jgi:hypothetical protein
MGMLVNSRCHPERSAFQRSEGSAVVLCAFAGMTAIEVGSERLRGVGERQLQKQPQILRSAYPMNDETVHGAPKRSAQDDTAWFCGRTKCGRAIG